MTISKSVFSEAWQKLEGRFGKQPPGSAADYLAHLTEILTEDEFLEAVRAVWATREFFPRPADFLLIRQGEDWTKILEATDLARKKLDWGPVFKSMSPTGQMSIKALGGIFVVTDRMQSNPGMIRKDFTTEYEMSVTTLAVQTALPASKDSLPEVTPESRRIVGEVLANARQLIPPTEGTP